MSTETIAPKIIQRPAAVVQLQKRPVEETATSRSDASAMKVIAKANPSPLPTNDESCSNDPEREEKKYYPNMTTVNNDNDGSAADTSTASAEEWNPLEEVDSALLTALCDPKERKALVRLESILVDFMKDSSLASIDVGGAFNSIVVGLGQLQSSENETSTITTTTITGGGGVGTNEEDATTFVPSQSQGIQDLLNQYQRGVRQTSFQRLILHRLADRFNIVREQINNVNPTAATTSNNERNASERGLVDVGVNNNNNNYINNNWSPQQQQQQQQQQQNSFPLGLIRLIKKEESCPPDHLLINLDLSLLVNYKNPRARNFVPNNNNNNNAEEGMRTLSDNMNAASLDNPTGVTSMPGPKKPNKKMVIMKRNSSSNTSGSGEGLGNGNREGRSRRKKLEDRERAYEEARARIFGKEEKKEAEGISDEKGESAAIQENSSPLNSCHSSFSVDNNEVPPTVSESVDVSNGSNMGQNVSKSKTSKLFGSADEFTPTGFLPSQLISGATPMTRSASPSPEPPGSSLPESPLDTEGGQKQGLARTKAVYRNRQQEENDPDFRRRSAYVPASMGVAPNGHLPGVPYNMVNPYAVNPYSTAPGQHVVMMQQQPPHFYPHPGQVTPQDPQSLHYPGYSQPRVFYPAQPPAQPQQPQSQHHSAEHQVHTSVARKTTNDSPQVAPRPENTAPRVNDSQQPQIPSWGPRARVEIKKSPEPAAIQQPQSQPHSVEHQVHPSVARKATNVAPQVAPRPENTAPHVNDSQQPQIPSWGPRARVEIKKSPEPAAIQQPQSQPHSVEHQVHPSVARKATNVAPQVAPRPENTAPHVNDSQQPQIPSWGPRARVEVKKSPEPAAQKHVAPAKIPSPVKKITTPQPAKNEKGDSKTILYKEEDFPALG